MANFNFHNKRNRQHFCAILPDCNLADTQVQQVLICPDHIKENALVAWTYKAPYGSKILQYASHAFFGTMNLPSTEGNVCTALQNLFQTLLIQLPVEIILWCIKIVIIFFP